jgi:hypothetical protein
MSERRRAQDRRRYNDTKELLKKVLEKMSGSPDLLEVAKPHLPEILERRNSSGRRKDDLSGQH